MSVEINKTSVSIELSEQELDAVAGGAIEDVQGATFNADNNQLLSGMSVGPAGVSFQTLALDADVASTGERKTLIDSPSSPSH